MKRAVGYLVQSSLILVLLSGCMSLTIQDSLLVNSTIGQEKPIEAGISTTGKDLGELVKAAGWGGPSLDFEKLQGLIGEWRKLRNLTGQ